MSNEELNIQDNEELNIQDKEPEVEVEPKPEEVVTGPDVDPTQTFTDWKSFEDLDLMAEGLGEKKEDHIPLPKVDTDGYKVLNPNPHVSIKKPIMSIKPSRKGFLPLFNFPGHYGEVYAAVGQYDIHGQRKRKEYLDDHSEALDYAHQAMIPDSYYWRSQWRVGSNWTNLPMVQDRDMSMGPTNTGTLISDVQLGNTGNFSTGLNNGFTLWHSGFTVRIKTPTGPQLAEVDATIANERNVFGRRTSGALFSSTRCYLESAILDLFTSCLDHSNIEGWTPEIVRSLVDERDIQLIAIALQAAKYPTAYPLMEPCSEANANCRNIREVSLTPMNTLIVDMAYFSPEEIAFLYARTTKRTVKEIEEFQEKARWNRKSTVRLTANTEIRIKHPRAAKVHEAGFIWAGDISASTHRVLADDSPTRNRVAYMNNLIDRDSLRSFLPYIDAILVNEVEREATEDELMTLMSHFSDDPSIVRRLELDIREFEDRDVVAWMGLPRHTCEECEKRLAIKNPELLKEYQAHPIMIPQDAVSRFFTFRRL